jgi:DNA-binding transcriptional MerR regulator
MVTPISKITKDLNIKPHQLHKWEERGWLGYQPVLKDPGHNGQRVYSEEQLQRIHVIYDNIEDQRKRGMKRTNLTEVEAVLLEKFGGEVTRIEKEEVMVLPSSIETLMELMRNQNKKIAELQETVERLEQNKLELKDHTPALDEMKKKLENSEEREEKLLLLIGQLKEDIEDMKKQQSPSVLTDKEEKQSLWQRLRGK